MLNQYIITLGARSAGRDGHGAVGVFTQEDYRLMEKIIRKDRRFPGCTIIRCKGFWKGKDEDAVQVLIVSDDYKKVKGLANQLRKTFRQESALLVSAGTGEFLT